MMGWIADHAGERDAQTTLIQELEGMGASAPVIAFVARTVMEWNLTYGQVAQRIRRAHEKRDRVAQQLIDRPELKARAIAAYAYRCAYCSRTGTHDNDPDGASWALDRIFPGKFGGEYEASNVALACTACNNSKGANITFCPPPSVAALEAA